MEDDDAIREAVVDVLREDGYDVSAARNGAEAMGVLESAPPPCVVLVDLMMPVMTGWELVDRMRAHDTLAGVPVVVTSAAADRSPPGVNRVLRKPLSLDALVAAVAEHCAAVGEPADASRRDDALRELARQNIELAELQRFRDEMSALIVHDMKNPVAVIRAALDYVLEGPLSSEEDIKREALLDAQSAAERVTRLIQNLLDLVKLESGRFLPRRAAVTAEELVGPVVERRGVLARQRGITLAASARPRVSLEVDADLVARTFENVLDNAFRHVPRGGRIEVHAAASATALAVRIGNTGAPIPAAAREHVFQKFGQAGDAGRTNLGLGLYFCRLVLEAHGGRIWVEETPELPTVFAMELPL